MQNFHDNKLWQDSFVVLMDIHDVVDELELSDTQEELIEAVLQAAQSVTAKIADGLSRVDRRISHDLLFDAIGLVAMTRTQLAVAWGRGIVDDATFKTLDDKYATLSVSLQSSK